MTDIEERVTTLETSLLTIANTIYAMIQNNMGTEMSNPTLRLPFEREPSAPTNPCNHHLLPAPTPKATFHLSPLTFHLHFGLDPQQRAHWTDVYSRLVAARLLHADEVSGANFAFLMCGAGTPPLAPIRWYGTTRELAYMVRRHLNSRWEVALVAFKDKKGSELPNTLKNTKPPCDNSARKMDRIFRTRD